MTQSDFNSSFRNLLNEPLPPAPDPRQIAFELFRRDQQRTRLLATLSLLFWVLGTAGIFLLVFSINRLVMESQMHPYGAPRPSVYQPASPGDGIDSVDGMIHQHLPPIAITKMCAVVEVSVVALLIAALLTVALIFSSRQATLNRINISLMQIAEQLSRAPQGGAPGGTPPGIAYSLPPGNGRFGSSALIKILIVLAILLLLGVPVLWLAARASAAREQAVAYAEVARARADFWHGYPRLSPFEAVQWQGQAPHVQVRGRWHELLSIDGLSADHVVALCEALDPDNWKKRFEEDLVEVLTRGGHPIGTRVALELKDLETGRIERLRDVPMTEENRQALWRAAATRPDDPKIETPGHDD